MAAFVVSYYQVEPSAQRVVSSRVLVGEKYRKDWRLPEKHPVSRDLLDRIKERLLGLCHLLRLLCYRIDRIAHAEWLRVITCRFGRLPGRSLVRIRGRGEVALHLDDHPYCLRQHHGDVAVTKERGVVKRVHHHHVELAILFLPAAFIVLPKDGAREHFVRPPERTK